MAQKHSSLGDRAEPLLQNEMKMVISQEEHTVSTPVFPPKEEAPQRHGRSCFAESLCPGHLVSLAQSTEAGRRAPCLGCTVGQGLGWTRHHLGFFQNTKSLPGIDQLVDSHRENPLCPSQG